MVVVIPITIGMPAMAVFVPPAVPLRPATLAGLMQFVTPVVSLPAVPAVVLHGFMQFVVRLGYTPLASIVIFGGRPRRSCKCQHANKCRSCKHRPSQKLPLSRVKRHVSPTSHLCPG